MGETKYYLITDASAAEVEARTGLHGRDTPFGVFLDNIPDMASFYEAKAKFDRAFNPKLCTCTVIHRPGCPAGDIIT